MGLQRYVVAYYPPPLDPFFVLAFALPLRSNSPALVVDTSPGPDSSRKCVSCENPSCISLRVTRTLEAARTAMEGLKARRTVKDVSPLEFIKAYAAHLKRSGKCDPYFDQIGCAHPGCEPAYPTPLCEKKCHVKNLLWEENKRFSVNAYRISSNVHSIMAEVYQNGPVEVAFTVYEDFAHYKSGVYRHITGDVLGGHAVKLIGWGTSEEGDDYWLLANQWNRGWGDDGYFKILRGTNECEIEDDVVAGLPSAKNLLKNFAEMDAATDASA